MLNDATLSADGLSPSWRLTDGAGNPLAGYNWTTAGVYGVGNGSLKYNITYAAPVGLTQWTLEMRDNLGGPVASAAINAAPGIIEITTSTPAQIIIEGS